VRHAPTQILGRWRPAVLGAAALLAASFSASSSRANGPIGANGTPITTSRYAIDLFRGPVFAGSRTTGLGGAYVAIGWDVDGMLQNPAAPAVRPFFSVTDFDYWLGLGLTLPGSLSGMDFFNSGTKSQEGDIADAELFISPAAMIQFGNFGFGLNLELQRYELGHTETETGQAARLFMSFDIAHVQAAYAFAHGALVLGMGSRILRMSARLRTDDRESQIPLSSTGTGIEFGVLWKPPTRVFSLGGAFRTGIETTTRTSDGAVINAAGDAVLATNKGDIYLPERAVLPWDLNLGAAVELGDDPENKPWLSDRGVAQRWELGVRLRMIQREDELAQAMANAPDAEARRFLTQYYAQLKRADQAEIDGARKAGYWTLNRQMARAPRRHVLLSGSVLVTGRADSAVGIESLVSQQVNRSGQYAVFSPRLGAEMEVIPSWLRLRSGVYVEPTRFETSTARPHYTGGFDLRAVRWNVFGLWPDDYLWRLGVGMDFARSYSSVSVTVAGWYPRHRAW
jgi:hypothetical protein